MRSCAPETRAEIWHTNKPVGSLTTWISQLVSSLLKAELFRVLFAFVRVISWIVSLVQLTNDPRNHAKTTKGSNTKKTSFLQTASFARGYEVCRTSNRYCFVVFAPYST